MSILPRVPGLASLLLISALALVPVAARCEEKPATVPDPEIARLIDRLGNQDFAARQRAQEELAKLGFRAFDALSAATRNADLEIAARARYLLGLMRMHWSEESDPAKVREQLDKYGVQSIDGRCQRIRALARLRGGVGIPALCRLVLFEESELLSKYAAVEILSWDSDAKGESARLAQSLRSQLAASKRTAAKWLLTAEALRENPTASQSAWIQQVESEIALSKSTPGQSNTQIVVALLYYLAEIQAAQGQNKAAEATAQRARQFNPGSLPTQLVMHLEIAQELQHRGLFPWADQEYSQVSKAGIPELAFVAQRARAEMWHDQGKNLDAAESLKQALRLLEQIGPGNLAAAESSPEELRARMNYFFACHWADKEDPTQQLKSLEKALESDKAEIDVLIACWNLKNQPDAFRSRIGALIDRAAAQLRRQIGNPPEDASACNQFAWLVGNTRGDLDEALRYSLKSIELSPDSGALYDTLAHVYFAKGDLASAVKNQTRAAELEPHSRLIERELARFRAALEQQSPGKSTAGSQLPPATPRATSAEGRAVPTSP